MWGDQFSRGWAHAPFRSEANSPLPRQLRHDLIDRLVCDHHHLFIRSVLYRMLGENRRRIETQ